MMTVVAIGACLLMFFCYGSLAREQRRKGERGWAALSSLAAAVWIAAGVYACL